MGPRRGMAPNPEREFAIEQPAVAVPWGVTESGFLHYYLGAEYEKVRFTHGAR
jgi:hypothetical protein